jgi:hypothetical protein
LPSQLNFPGAQSSDWDKLKVWISFYAVWAIKVAIIAAFFLIILIQFLILKAFTVARIPSFVFIAEWFAAACPQTGAGWQPCYRMFIFHAWPTSLSFLIPAACMPVYRFSSMPACSPVRTVMPAA